MKGQNQCVLAAAAWLLAADPCAARRPDGYLELAVIDAETRQPVAARLHLTDTRGRPVAAPKGRDAWGVARLGDHAYLDGKATLGLRRGVYRFLLDAGPEYRTQHGHFEIARHAEDSKTVEVRRHARLADEGWFAADLASCRPPENLPLLQRAEQLAYTPTIVAVWEGKQWAPPRLAEHGRRHTDTSGATAVWSTERGTVWLIDPDESRAIADLPTPSESLKAFLGAAREDGWRVIASITSRELPLWIAHDLIDALVVIKGDIDQAEPGRKPDPLLFPGEQGLGRWRRHLYESLVDAGVSLPPVALTGSGLNTLPLGSSRVYAFTDGDPSCDAWWRAVEDRSVFVTNGPLLRAFVAGTPPGSTFLLGPGETRAFSITLSLATRSKIEYLELIKNGRVERNVRLADVAANGGRLPEIAFDAPGWLAVAAVTSATDRYEYAMSAPWFVEDAKGPRIDREACEAWLAALAEARDAFGASDPEAYNEAEAWWRAR
ncbi:MAG: hypothetical protein AAF266_11780 [Planctomycetota bacterium]